MPDTLRIELVYALPERCRRWPLRLPEGATVADALAAAPLHEVGLDRTGFDGRVGVFGHVVEPDHRLRDGDRVELYRALLNDPKEVRRRRAAETAPRRR